MLTARDTVADRVQGLETGADDYLVKPFAPEDLVARVSEVMTLMPGDIIATGTPSGVGVAMKPPSYRRIGDVMRVEIDGIGHIENIVVAEPNRAE